MLPGGRRRAELLLELAQGDGQRLLALLDLALGDRPGALVLGGPERPAHVRDQHLQAAAGPPVEQQAGAAPGHQASGAEGLRARLGATRGASSGIFG